MKLFLAAILFIMTGTSAISQDQRKDQTSLYYLERQPKIKVVKPPLLILLHGIGSNEEDLFSFANQLPGNFLVISARAPQTISPGSYAWFEIDLSTGTRVINSKQAETSRQTIIKFIGELKQKYTFDEQQVYLCGFSQGAIMSYSVGLTRPDLIKGIAVMSGRLLEEVKPMIAPKEKLQRLKIYISHGNNDNTLPVQYARDGLAFLKTLNIAPTYKEYNEGHGINNEMLNDLISWLSKN